MTVRGHVKNGVVVLEPGTALPEGAEVRLEITASQERQVELDENGRTLGQKLLRYAGKAVGLPPDAARNHDHYLYGTPKR
jgi:hypothetical protein